MSSHLERNQIPWYLLVSFSTPTIKMLSGTREPVLKYFQFNPGLYAHTTNYFSHWSSNIQFVQKHVMNKKKNKQLSSSYLDYLSFYLNLFLNLTDNWWAIKSALVSFKLYSFPLLSMPCSCQRWFWKMTHIKAVDQCYHHLNLMSVKYLGYYLMRGFSYGASKIVRPWISY